MSTKRFDRNERLFGAAGQERISTLTVGVVGVGGLGTHVVQQLALLGVGGLVLIDGEIIEPTNFNRYIGLYAADAGQELWKVDLGERLAKSIRAGVEVATVHDTFISTAGFSAVERVDLVFGCVDSDGARLVLNEYCSAYERPYIDLASDVVPGDPLRYGGHVCTNITGDGCVVCLDLIDTDQAGRDLSSDTEAHDRLAIYGVDENDLAGAGPAVVSLNGVVASLGVTEFMVWASGLRDPANLLRYHGDRGIVTTVVDSPRANCHYCGSLRGRRTDVMIARFIR